MAHFLILLAQGAAPPVDSRPPPPALAMVSQEARQETSSLPPPGPLPAPATKTERYTSCKYMEAATTADGVSAGFYMYECKTCNNATNVAIAKLSKPPAMKTASPPLRQMTTASPPPPPPTQVGVVLDVTTVLSLNNGGSAVCNATNTR
ncbi:hypothetical protein ZWY2020_038496 [Hordeum vulgare]|nr:hypothetical protein ZWY2020_038496 [Hordeum vulgare]